jgi:hypothetical protein
MTDMVTCPLAHLWFRCIARPRGFPLGQDDIPAPTKTERRRTGSSISGKRRQPTISCPNPERATLLPQLHQRLSRSSLLNPQRNRKTTSSHLHAPHQAESDSGQRVSISVTRRESSDYLLPAEQPWPSLSRQSSTPRPQSRSPTRLQLPQSSPATTDQRMSPTTNLISSHPPSPLQGSWNKPGFLRWLVRLHGERMTRRLRESDSGRVMRGRRRRLRLINRKLNPTTHIASYQ